MKNAKEMIKKSTKNFNTSLYEMALINCENDIEKMASRGARYIVRHIYGFYMNGNEDRAVAEKLGEELRKNGYSVSFNFYEPYSSVSEIIISW